MQQHGRPHRPQAKGVGLVRRALRFGEELGTEESGSVVRGELGTGAEACRARREEGLAKNTKG